MKIVYIIQSLYNPGGTERILTDKANYLAEIFGYSVYIVTLDQRFKAPYFGLSNKIFHIDLGINYDSINGKNILFKIFVFLYKQNRLKFALKNLLDEINPSCVITLTPKCYSFLYSLNKKSKKIIEIHFSKYGRGQLILDSNWSSIQKIVYRIREAYDNHFISKYHKFVILTHEDKKNWGGCRNLEVIPNFTSIPNCSVSSVTNKSVIAVGRFEYQKGFDLLIPIWRLVADKHPDWKLHIFGDGSLRFELLDLIKAHGLEGNITLNKPTRFIGEKYTESSIYLMTSRFEGLPLVLIEAMSHGLPVVSFACKCGPLDIISDGIDGYLVAEGGVETFVNRVNYLIENPAIRKKFSLEAQKNIKRFSIECVMSKWDSVFKQTDNIN